MCSDADSEGPVVLAGGDSEEDAPAQCGDVRQHWLATASDDVEMFGAHVQEELGAAELGATVGLGSWEPGWNAGTWVTSARTPDEQSQVLICNAYLVAKRLPKELLQSLADFFGRKKTSQSLCAWLRGSWA
jgi:hypothetical protein